MGGSGYLGLGVVLIMATFGFLRRIARDRVIVAVLVLLVGSIGWVIFRNRPQRAARLRLSAGSAQGLRHNLGESLASEALRRGVDLSLIPTAGSETALDRLDAGLIDLALIQGGLDPRGRKNVRQVAALHLEPLHLLVKRELVAEVRSSLEALRGRRINLGEVGSGTRSLASDVLSFAGLEAGQGYQAESLTYAELEAHTQRDRLPDAVFTVSLLPSPVVRNLVAKHGFDLIPLPFGEALALDGNIRRDRAGPPNGPRHEIRRDQVDEASIPAFTYGVRPAVPFETLQTLGTRLLLVAHKDVSPEAVASLLDATFNSPFTQLAHPPLTHEVLDLPPEFPVHPGTQVYQERSKPLFTGDVIDAIEKEISIAGALIGGSFFLWQWLKSRYRRLRESGFEHFILRVAAIEEKALRLELAEALDLPALIELQDELGRIKAHAIARFAEGELEGEDLLSGFLAQASDARDHLTRLILHRRDDLERQARKQKRDAAALWREAVGEDSAPSVPPDLPISVPSE